MPRYDKYDPYDGGFRAPLAFSVLAADGFDAIAVGLDANGHVVKGAGQTGIVGVYIPHGAKKIGDIADVMTDGEIVEWTADGASDGAAAAAGTKYYGVTADGTVNTTNTGTALGFTAEAERLIVRAAR